jgi:CBS domain-containing protein
MPSFPTLHADQIMTKALICARPEQDLHELELLLVEHRISGVPVVEQGRLVGVVSRSDIARVQVLMKSLDGQVTDELRRDDQADGFQHNERPEFQGFRQMLDKLKVKDAMHDQVVTCTPATSVGEVAAMMVRQHVHRIIVVEADRPVGIISSLDLLRLLASGMSESARKQR